MNITFEHEHNNTFSFLGVKICRENNKLKTSAYREVDFLLISKVLYSQFRNLV